MYLHETGTNSDWHEFVSPSIQFFLCVYMRQVWQWTQTGLILSRLLEGDEKFLHWSEFIPFSCKWQQILDWPGQDVSSLYAFESAVYLLDKTYHFVPILSKVLQKYHTGTSSYSSEFILVSYVNAPQAPISKSRHKQLSRTLSTLKVDTVLGISSTLGIVQFGQKCKNNKNLNAQLILPPKFCTAGVRCWCGFFYLVKIFQGIFFISKLNKALSSLPSTAVLLFFLCKALN